MYYNRTSYYCGKEDLERIHNLKHTILPPTPFNFNAETFVLIIICLPFDSSDQKTLPGYTPDLSSCFEPISSFFPSIDSSSPSQFLYFDTLTCALDPTTKIYIQQISNEILAATRVIALRGIHQSLQCKISSTLFSGHIKGNYDIY